MTNDLPQTGEVSAIRQSSRARCDLRGTPTADIHCKKVCFNCGYTRDCSDP